MSHRIDKDGNRVDRLFCNKCNTARLKEWRTRNPENRAKIYANARRYNSKNKVKFNAWMNMHYHLKKGHIERPKECGVCGEKKKLDGHHDDYSKPLEVKWMCRKCHKAYHKEHDK